MPIVYVTAVTFVSMCGLQPLCGIRGVTYFGISKENDIYFFLIARLKIVFV